MTRIFDRTSVNTASALLLKEHIHPEYDGSISRQKYDFHAVYGMNLWMEMDDLLDEFPAKFSLGSHVDTFAAGEWDINLLETEHIDFIELGIRSCFVATQETIKESAGIWSESLEERVQYFSALPDKFRIGIPAEAESKWFQGYMPNDAIKQVATILSDGFPDDTEVSPIICYAEKRDIGVHPIPSEAEAFSEFMAEFSGENLEFDNYVDQYDWDDDDIETPRKLFVIEIAIYLPVITPEFRRLPETERERLVPSQSFA